MSYNDRFDFEIVKNIGKVPAPEGKWAIEVNVVSWNGRDPKIDVRPWSPDHQKMGKGIALTREEAIAVLDLIKAASSEPLGTFTKKTGPSLEELAEGKA